MNAKALKIIAAASSLIAIPVFANNVATPEAKTHMTELFSELDKNKDNALDRTELTPVAFYGLTLNDVFARYDIDNSKTLSESEYQGMQDYLTLKQQSYSQTEPDTVEQNPISMETQETRATRDMPANSDVDLEISVQTAPSVPEEDVLASTAPDNLNKEQAPVEMAAPELEEQANQNTDSVAELKWSEKNGIRGSAADTLTETTPQMGEATNDITIAENVYSADVKEIVGAEVKDDTGQRLGEVESILIDKQGMEAGVLISTEQEVTLFTPVKYLRLENDSLVLIEGVTPNASYDESRFRKIESSAESINSALRRLELSHTY